MKKMMRAVVLGASVLGIVGTMAPAASANSAGDTIHGGCFFNTDENAVATNGQNQGVIGDHSVTTDASNAPTGATVTCVIEVNGVKQSQTQHSYSGTGAQAGVDQIVFTADSNATVLLCEDVTYADGTTEPETCPAAISQQIPPQQVIDLLNSIFDTLNGLEIQFVDPVVCPELVALGAATGGGVPGVVDIHADGDVYVPDPLGLGLNPVYDCPPYLPPSS